MLIGYVIGMFPSADLVARLARGGRSTCATAGSGNPGGLNAARVLGKKWGLLVIVMDTAKGASPASSGLAIGDPGAYAAGTAVIAGHCWPVYNGFRGGQGRGRRRRLVLRGVPADGPIDGLATAAVALVGKSSRLAIRAALVIWVASAAVWWAADSPCGGVRSPVRGCSCTRCSGPRCSWPASCCRPGPGPIPCSVRGPFTG